MCNSAAVMVVNPTKTKTDHNANSLSQRARFHKIVGKSTAHHEVMYNIT